MVGRRRTGRKQAGDRTVPDALTVVAIALLVAAFGAAVWFGIGWGKAQFSERPVAHARDDSLAAAAEAAVNLSSFDIADLDSSFAKIDAVVTGDLATDLTANRPMLTQVLLERQASSTAEVTNAGLVELDRGAHTATAIVVMKQVTQASDGPQQWALVTSLVTVQRFGDRWLAVGVEQLGNATLTGSS